MPEDYTDILIRVFPQDQTSGTYPVEAELDDRSRFLDGEFRLDEQALLISQLDAQAYGLLLFNALFSPGGPVRRAYDQATGRAQERSGGALRVRLWIDDEAVTLHALPWERLYHLHKGQLVPLTTSGLTPFSRYTGLELGEPQPLGRRPARMLITIANPTNLPQDLAELDVDREVESLSRALGELRRTELLEVTILPGRSRLGPELSASLRAEGFRLAEGATSLANILRHLADADLWHHLGHGHFKREGDTGVSALFLEKEDGSWKAEEDADVVSKLVAAARTPHLIFLAACESAKRHELHPFVGLAPKLVQAGTPAVVAMQDLVPLELARRLAADFYRGLFQHGQVDLAMNQARLLLFERDDIDWAIPVLYSRLAENELIRLPPDEALQHTDQMMQATQQLLSAVQEEADGRGLARQLEGFLGQWRESHQALVDLDSGLRRIEDDPQTFAQDFDTFYDDFKDYYNSQTWVTENSLIQNVQNLRDQVLPKLEPRMERTAFNRVRQTLDQHIGSRRKLVMGFDGFLESMDRGLTEIKGLVDAGQIDAAIQRKREFELEIAPNLGNSRHLLRQMSQQIDTVAGLLAKMERQMSRGQVVPEAEITEALLAHQDPGEPLDAITQDLMESQGVDMRVVQKPGTAAAPPHVEAQIGELMAAQGAVAAQGKMASAESLYRLGMLAAYGRDYPAALDYFHQATQADPALHDAYRAIAWLQQSRAMDDIFASNYGLATDKLKEASHAAAQIQPPDAQTLTLLGYIAKSLAQAAAPVADQDQERRYYQQAAELFRQAAALDPTDVSAQNGLANVMYALGDVEGAIQSFRQVVTIEPRYTAAWHDLGVACVTQMQQSNPAQAATWRDEALRAFREAYRLAQEDPSFSEESVHRIEDYVEWLAGGGNSEMNSPS